VNKHGGARKATDDNITRRMCFACWITKATDTRSGRVTLIAFRDKSGYTKAPFYYFVRTFHLFLFRGFIPIAFISDFIFVAFIFRIHSENTHFVHFIPIGPVLYLSLLPPLCCRNIPVTSSHSYHLNSGNNDFVVRATEAEFI
jgi:hypothetical protein